MTLSFLFKTSLLQTLTLQSPSSKRLWRITWPMILANISVPLLGFVDTAVIGHLSHPGFLAGTALGSLVVTVLFWLLGFLRMSTTGLIAQTSKSVQQQVYVVQQGIIWSLLLSVVILLAQSHIFSGLLHLVDQTKLSIALQSAQQYFSTRIWIAPIALMNLVFAGFYIGRGLTKFVLVGVLLSNAVNLILDVLFVPLLGFGVVGVAYASIMAEVVLWFFYVFGLTKHLREVSWLQSFSFRLDTSILKLNAHLFLRSLLLQLCLSFLTIYATRFGELEVAVNAILMQFFLFISFSLDGVAFALESLIGKAKGEKQSRKIQVYIRTGIIVASLFAIFYTLAYLLFHTYIINLLTSIESITTLMSEYLLWIVLFPVVSYMSFVMDGIFVGLAWSRKMLLSMFTAALIFFVVFSLSIDMNNHGLWLAFSCFMLMRGVVQCGMLFSNRNKLL